MSLIRLTHCTCALHITHYLTKYKHNSEEIHILYKKKKTRVKSFLFFFWYPDFTALGRQLKWSYSYPRAAGSLPGNSLATNRWEWQKTEAPPSESFPLFPWAWNYETTKNTTEESKNMWETIYIFIIYVVNRLKWNVQIDQKIIQWFRKRTK